MKAVFLDARGLDDLDLNALKASCGELTMHLGTRPEEAATRIADAEVVIVNKVPLPESVLAQASNLKLICVVATGTNHICLDTAKARGIAVYNAQAYGIHAVAQHTLTLILALHTNLLNYHRAVQQGRWQQALQFCLLDFPIVELHGKTLGIVGYGALGQEVARIASAFGMQVCIAARSATDDRPGRLPLNELLKQVDVLSLHCPLTPQTRDLIGEKELVAMKPSAMLINVARGGVVNETALVAALERGEIAGAATDVLTQEPPVAGNPLLVCNLPNLIVTPHSAWGSQEARETIVRQTVENLAFFQRGEVTRRVV